MTFKKYEMTAKGGRGGEKVVLVPWFPLCVGALRRRTLSSERTDFMILPGYPISSTSCERNASDKNADKPPSEEKKRTT